MHTPSTQQPEEGGRPRPHTSLRCARPARRFANARAADPLPASIFLLPSFPPPPAVPHAWGWLRSRLRRVLSWQAPPRRLWTWWCGGMDVQDTLVLAFVLALNIYYFVYYMQSYNNRANASE